MKGVRLLVVTESIIRRKLTSIQAITVSAHTAKSKRREEEKKRRRERSEHEADLLKDFQERESRY